MLQLEELYLFNNRILSLPERMGQLRDLHTLDLHSNHMAMLHPGVCVCVCALVPVVRVCC